MEGYEITTKMNLKNTIAETREFAKAMTEFANTLEQIEKKYAEDVSHETVTEFADRCKECGARYGRLLNRKSDMLDNIKNEITMLHVFNRQNVIEIIDKYKEGSKQ